MSMEVYNRVYSQMEDNTYYTASELDVAAASLTAMAKRGMVEVIKGRPNKYIKVKINSNTTNLNTILENLKQVKDEDGYVHASFNDHAELIIYKGGEWYHCDGKTKLTMTDYSHMTSACRYVQGQVDKLVNF